jgi:predicted RNase H-like nuclease
VRRFLGIDLAWGEGSEEKRANKSGVVALESSGRITDAGWTTGLDETLDWVQDQADNDTLLFVDAPLVINNATGPRLADRETGRHFGRWWVSANSVNLNSPRRAGVHLRERLTKLGWCYSDGREGPPASGRVISECYPYTTLVGVSELRYDDKRPQYKRAPKGVRAAEAWPLRMAACDELIRRLSRLASCDPPLDLSSHAATRRLVEEPSPKGWRDYKPREDLLDAAICAWTAAYWSRYGLDRCLVLGAAEGRDDTPAAATIIAPARPEQRNPLLRVLSRPSA